MSGIDAPGTITAASYNGYAIGSYTTTAFG